MNVILQKSSIANQSSIVITGSKSESNRLLLLQALFPEINIKNLSNSDDTKVMQYALQTSEDHIDIHHAGTAMRFLTAYFATQEHRKVVLTGSSRMKERPIKILVEALNTLGADIAYLESEDCPPLKINGQQLIKDKVTLNANVSSQYISALLLVAPKLTNGLELTLEGEITSVPYINMTLDLLHQIGVKTEFEANVISVSPKTTKADSQTLIVESDWSSASYFYSILALSPVGTQITLSSYKQNSLQGDSALITIYKDFGVETRFNKNAIVLKKTAENVTPKMYNLNNSPDIAQTIAVTCLGLGIECQLSGLHTLKIKETDRLEALKIEIEKLGGQIDITENSLHLFSNKSLNCDVSIDTYNDHRMAMAFAPLALKISIQINEANVVSKSFPSFWEDLKTLGFNIS
ncbi:3-phosphoshikimate 1-carboxyvinyltransferase [Psychroserpens ponticola]|uniref:3-phosphoshikimate 1-carboxyvinyltransferase n=1 Tax=Psychroserpens ponticola TaxID=2932268 RepID=A0ABY7RYP8_9FLAO|nr:3-phosphoshikimate 1-carboxyvinyltransferase [Psychroserpens ponticola]WCO02163.1 3-phosphoshikimate 1-carboxyvinyltransferase [Psychroserpens ponticola]